MIRSLLTLVLAILVPLASAAPPATRPAAATDVVAPPAWPAGATLVFSSWADARVRAPGVVPIWCEGGSSGPGLFRGGWVDPLSIDLADDAALDASFAVVAQAGATRVILDIEHLDWSLDASTRKTRHLIERLRLATPRVQVGVYGLPDSYWAFANDDPPAVQRLRAQLDRLTYGLADDGGRREGEGLLDAVDFLVVGVYHHYPDRREIAGGKTQADAIYRDRDVAAARGNLAEARRAAPGKPVVALHMLTVHETGEPVADTRRDAVLAACREAGAFNCLWGGDDRPPQQAAWYAAATAVAIR